MFNPKVTSFFLGYIKDRNRTFRPVNILVILSHEKNLAEIQNGSLRIHSDMIYRPSGLKGPKESF